MKRREGLFLARPTRDKTPLIGTWLGVGSTDSTRVEGAASASAPTLGVMVVVAAKEIGVEEVAGPRRVLHTPLHLLVNRINQRHHGLSLIPPFSLASIYLNLLPSTTAGSIAIYSATCTDATLQHPLRRVRSDGGGGRLIAERENRRKNVHAREIRNE